MRLEHPPIQFLPAKALKLLENVLELKLRKLQKIILKLVTAEMSTNWRLLRKLLLHFWTSFSTITELNHNYICLIHKPWLAVLYICLSLQFCIYCILFLLVTCSRTNKQSVECRYYKWQLYFHPTEKVSRNIFRRREVYLSVLLTYTFMHSCMPFQMDKFV